MIVGSEYAGKVNLILKTKSQVWKRNFHFSSKTCGKSAQFTWVQSTEN